MIRCLPIRGWTGFALAVLLAVWGQAVLAGRFAFVPDLPVLALAWIALDGRRAAVLPAAAVLGAATALFTVDPPVLRVAVAIGIASLLLAFRAALFRRHVLTVFGFVALAVLLEGLAQLLLLSPPDHPELLLRAATGSAASALVTGALACVVIPFFRRVGWCRPIVSAGPT